LRVFAGQTAHHSLQNQYFLGGFDSVRGLPDGAVIGNRAAYSNLEFRLITYKLKYMWFQNVVFFDSGSAASEWKYLGESTRACAGVGVRMSIPQIYRMMGRIDYAWSVEGKKTKGITIGLNQFFDPYKPL
jgi:hemolysin activation/secretion protein